MRGFIQFHNEIYETRMITSSTFQKKSESNMQLNYCVHPTLDEFQYDAAITHVGINKILQSKIVRVPLQSLKRVNMTKKNHPII